MNRISKNFSKPQGWLGSLMLSGMNKGHDKLTKWALSFVEIHTDSVVLDIGCGGGNAISLMSQHSDSVYGIDYSEVSVAKSKKTNQYGIIQGKIDIVQGSVSALPYRNQTFDFVTAFETIYFWPDIVHDFAEVARVLKPGGHFMTVFQNGITEAHSQKMEAKIDGMKIYPSETIEALLRQAGFAHVAKYEKRSSHWQDICIISKKE